MYHPLALFSVVKNLFGTTLALHVVHSLAVKICISQVLNELGNKLTCAPIGVQMYFRTCRSVVRMHFRDLVPIWNLIQYGDSPGSPSAFCS